jgi:hypothetical protein
MHASILFRCPSDLPGVNPATNDRMILYYCLKDQSGSVLGDSTVFSWAGCHRDNGRGRVLSEGEIKVSDKITLKHELVDDEDGGVVPPAEHVPTTSTTVVDGPSPTPTTTNQDRGEATVEGEVASRREPPR